MVLRDFTTVRYESSGSVATITLNDPDKLNAIGPLMPTEIRHAVELADRDDDVHVVILQGAGRAFCAGYDLTMFAERRGAPAAGSAPFDPTVDFRMMSKNTQDFMSLWNCSKPVIAKVHGVALAGGSDIALSCDLVVMADDARIGYPPARVWGIPTTMMWITRVGAERAKRMLFTGDLVSGAEAARMGLVLESVPHSQLDQRVQALALRIASVPRNQLFMSKTVVNQMVELQGLPVAQRFATFFDGFARHSQEGKHFEQVARSEGFHAAVKERDSGQPIAKDKSVPSYAFADLAESKRRSKL